MCCAGRFIHENPGRRASCWPPSSCLDTRSRHRSLAKSSQAAGELLSDLALKGTIQPRAHDQPLRPKSRRLAQASKTTNPFSCQASSITCTSATSGSLREAFGGASGSLNGPPNEDGKAAECPERLRTNTQSFCGDRNKIDASSRLGHPRFQFSRGGFCVSEKGYSQQDPNTSRGAAHPCFEIIISVLKESTWPGLDANTVGALHYDGLI